MELNLSIHFFLFHFPSSLLPTVHGGSALCHVRETADLHHCGCSIASSHDHPLCTCPVDTLSNLILILFLAWCPALERVVNKCILLPVISHI